MKYQDVNTTNWSGDKASFKRNQKGNVVLITLGAMIVLNGFLQTIGFSGILDNASVISASRIKASRDSISYQIERYASLPISIRNSLSFSENSELRNCVLGSSSALCNGDGTEYPLNLYDSSFQPQLIAGRGPIDTGGTPVLYDNKGNLCKTNAISANLSCPFEVRATFTAQCPAAVGTPCSTAESIKVHFVLRIPENIFLNAGIKNKMQLASVDKFAVAVKTSDILPHPYGYVPNTIKIATLIQEGTTTTTTTVPSTPTYEDAVAKILTVVGGENVELAKTIASRIYKNYEITDLELVGALASFWLKSPAGADSAADGLYRRMKNDPAFSPNAQYVNNVANAVLEYKDDSVKIVALAFGLLQDSATAKIFADALAGITDVITARVIVDTGIKDANVASAVSYAFANNEIAGKWSLIYQVAGVAGTFKLTNAETLKSSVGVILAGNYDRAVRDDILKLGITSTEKADQMQKDYEVYLASIQTTQVTTTADVSTTTVAPTSETTTTVGSTITQTEEVSSNSGPGSTSSAPTLVEACSSSTSCDGTVGL